MVVCPGTGSRGNMNKKRQMQQQHDTTMAHWKTAREDVQWMSEQSVLPEFENTPISVKSFSKEKDVKVTCDKVKLFEAVCIHRKEDGDEQQEERDENGHFKRGPKLQKDPFHCLADFVANAGGPVWTMDWCPIEEQTNDEQAGLTSYIAIECHPKGQGVNIVNQPLDGIGLIEIWKATYGSEQKAEDINLQFLYAIVHNGRISWQLKWCPDAQLSNSGNSKTHLSGLGLLAAALASGEILIYSPPSENDLRDLSDTNSSVNTDTDERFMRLKAVASTSELKERESMPSSIAWYPKKPYDLLLVGCWNGNIGIFQLGNPTRGDETSRVQRLSLMAFYTADLHPIRCITWISSADSTEEAKAYLYVTAGHSGQLKFWDIREPQVLKMQHSITYFQHIMSVALNTKPAGLLVTTGDGAITLLRFSEEGFEETSTVMKAGCFFSTCILKDTWAASNSEGELMVFYVKPRNSEKHFFSRSKIQCLRKSAIEEGVLLIGRAEDVPQKKWGSVPPKELHLYCISWMESLKSSKNFSALACGSGSGLTNFHFLTSNYKK